MAIGDKKRLGELLLARGLVSREELAEALRIQERTGERAGDILVRQGVITEHDLVQVMSEKLSIPCVNLDTLVIEPELTRRVPVEMARERRLIPIRLVDRTLTVAMADPLDLIAIEQLKYQTGLEITRVFASASQIERAIADYYSVQDSVAEAIREIGAGSPELRRPEAPHVDPAADAPLIRLVNMLLQQAIKECASDIHISPEEDALRVRFRVHGVMREAATPPRSLGPAFVTRIKIMAGMDVSEKRLPQDGRFSLRVDQNDIDFRVSTLPTIFGEKVVLRVLDRTHLAVKLQDLGLSPDRLERLGRLMKQPEGLILVTGPTGSGKTSTLYAMLRELNSPEKNIITVEDPVEYHFQFISQVQTNEKAGLLFANTLRSILRQDPDIIMIGEMRDTETSEIAVRAALTGHLVLSTLHANDAASTVARLLDMGVESYLVAASLQAVIAQRLVRRVCPECSEEASVPDALRREIEAGPGAVFRRGAGCRACRQSGFSGRLGIFEMLVVTDAVRELIARRAPTGAILAEARAEGMALLRQDGREKALAGLTTVEEVLRVSPAFDLASSVVHDLVSV